jgi:hypothetical protein
MALPQSAHFGSQSAGYAVQQLAAQGFIELA